MISKKDLKPRYVKITNFEYGTSFNEEGRRVVHLYNGIGRLDKIDDNDSLVEIADGTFVWIENSCLEWENEITEIKVIESEVIDYE